MTKISLALISLLVVGMAGVSQAQAGAGSVLLGQSTFESRCERNGGSLDGVNGAVACDFGDLLVSCDFAVAYAHCDWNGAQGHRAVTRLIGALTADSIVDGVDGSAPASGKGKGKGGGGFQQDLPKKGF
jgi:hypothetical protein